MKIVSWNVWCDNTYFKRANDIYSNFSADVVCAQELPQHWLPDTRYATSLAPSICLDFMDTKQTAFLGTFTTFPVIDYSILRMNQNQIPSDSIFGRTFYWTECIESCAVLLEYYQKRVCIINMHLPWAVSPRVRLAKVNMALEHFIGKYNDQADLFVLAGDFNDFSRRWNSLLLGLCNKYTLRDFFVNEKHELSYLLRDYHFFEPSSNLRTVSPCGFHLDHIFVRGANALSYDSCNERFGSDHHPVIIKLHVE